MASPEAIARAEELLGRLYSECSRCTPVQRPGIVQPSLGCNLCAGLGFIFDPANILAVAAALDAKGAIAKLHAEGLRGIRKMLREDPPDVDRAILWCSDSLSGYLPADIARALKRPEAAEGESSGE